jgi:hypothetical protein
LFGRLQSRIIFHLVKKEREGPEKLVYRGLAQIKEKFEEELAQATDGALVDLDKCGPTPTSEN